MKRLIEAESIHSWIRRDSAPFGFHMTAFYPYLLRACQGCTGNLGTWEPHMITCFYSFMRKESTNGIKRVRIRRFLVCAPAENPRKAHSDS